MTDTSQPKNLTNRRGFLRGLGAGIALPAFASWTSMETIARESSTTATLAQTSSGAPLRTAFVYFPNGVIQDTWWPEKQGTDFSLSPTLEPLGENRDWVQVLGGLDHENAKAGRDGAGDHARGGGVFLTGVRINKSATEIQSGVSIDQELANRVGHLTRFPSLELSCEPARTSGSCDSGYSCAYSYNLSWNSPTTPKTAESNPRLLFERMFGAGQPHQRLANLQQRRAEQRSILDFVLEDARALNRNLAAQDRAKLDEYLTAVRAIESRVQRAESLSEPRLTNQQSPTGIPKEYPEHMEVMFDLLLLAFQTDSTRIATLLLSHDGSNRSFTHIDVPEGHHDLSHHQNDETRIHKLKSIDRWYVQQFSRFLSRLREVEDKEGESLLDNSMIVFGSGNADGNRHTHSNLPVLLAGGGGGNLTPGRFVDYQSRPMCNLYLSLADRMGVTDLKRFGDSTGRLSDL